VTLQDETKRGTLPFPAAEDREVIRYSRVVVLYQLLLAAAFATLLVLTIVMDKNILAALLLLPLGDWAARLFWKATTREPALVIDAAGVRLPQVSERLVPWSDIHEIRKIRHRSLLISFEVDDPEPYAPPATTLRGKWLRLISHLGYPLISFWPHELQGRTSGILATIERYRAQASEASSSGR